jgi:nuclear transport factor 2 (NTF2) superfamily protein
MGATAIRRGNLTLYPNYKLGEELRRAGEWDRELRRLAELGALGAREIAVREFYGRDSHTGQIGAYYNSIHGQLGYSRKGLRVGLVAADDWKAHWAERGWTTRDGQKVKARKILARGGRRGGLRVRAPRKRG